MAAKSKPLSVRISADTVELIAAEANRTHRSKGAVIEGLAEEALRTRMYPGIAFRGEDWDRRPWVIGTSFDVWQIVDAHRDVGSVEAIVAEGNLSERTVRLALAYHERFPAEIEEAIARNRRPLKELRAAYPFIDAPPGANQ
ncbi:MAG TPA: ribbon-helix-helix protein, CopG family [Solirubrobacterales bacterium]|nr:ribbon-helix-helix protein, CopG family [Solirubrobacterales bacterium]